MSRRDKSSIGEHPVFRIIGYLDQRAPFPIGSLLLALLSAAYLLNPTGGFIELIPDNLPFIGNLDETGAAFLLTWGGSNLIRWWQVRRAQRQARKQSQ